MSGYFMLLLIKVKPPNLHLQIKIHILPEKNSLSLIQKLNGFHIKNH